MNNKNNFDTYLFLGKEKIEILVKKKDDSENYYNKDFFLDKKNEDNNFILLNEFLNENIFKIEKKLNFFVEDIYLIIEDKNFLTIEISLKKENDINLINQRNLKYLLKDAKTQINESYKDQKIIHMIINNYLIDNNYHKHFPKNINCDQLSVSITFICISKSHIKNLENIFRDYQIKIHQIISAQYLNDYFEGEQSNIFTRCQQALKGHNENEVLLVPKTSKSMGFFEKLFLFFN